MQIDETILPKDKETLGEPNELEYFQLLFSDEILEMLSEESNTYYKKVLSEIELTYYKKIIISKESTSSYQYLYVTKGITKEDILAYVGVRIYMGLHKIPSIERYWRTKSLYQPRINKIMGKNYFLLIGHALHFPEKEKVEKKNSKRS